MRLSEALFAAVVAVALVALALGGCALHAPTGPTPASQRASDTVPANCAFRAGLNECDKEYDA